MIKFDVYYEDETGHMPVTFVELPGVPHIGDTLFLRDRSNRDTALKVEQIHWWAAQSKDDDTFYTPNGWGRSFAPSLYCKRLGNEQR